MKIVYSSVVAAAWIAMPLHSCRRDVGKARPTGQGPASSFPMANRDFPALACREAPSLNTPIRRREDRAARASLSLFRLRARSEPG